MANLRKEARELLKDALAAGWVVVRQNGHTIVRHPDGRWDSIPSSPSDHRGLINKRKRMGLYSNGLTKAASRGGDTAPAQEAAMPIK